MAKKKRRLDPFGELTWDDLDRWAGSRIVSRGRKYQQQGRVSELAWTGDGGLIGWVRGSRRYATKAVMAREGKQDQWARYLWDLKDTHRRKRRLIEVLDGLTGKRIVAGRR